MYLCISIMQSRAANRGILYKVLGRDPTFAPGTFRFRKRLECSHGCACALLAMRHSLPHCLVIVKFVCIIWFGDYSNIC